MAAIWTKWGFTERDYFHVLTGAEGRTWEHRGTPPIANGSALNSWENDLAKHVAGCKLIENLSSE